MILGRKEILAHDPPLVEGLRPEQVQPNGVDVTVGEIMSIDGSGTVDFDNSQRAIPPATPLGWYSGSMQLPPGCYKIVFAEVLNLPMDICAISQTRSSLLRMGVSVHTGVGDAGYRGRCEALMVVYNPEGVKIFKGARITQLVFMRIESPVNEGYKGRYQGENL